MNKFKGLVVFVLAIGVVFGGFATRVEAEDAENPTVATLLEQVQILLQQIQDLQARISELQGRQAEIRQEFNTTLKLTRSLSQGMTNEEVELLQEILATDPEIYPEGLKTGYFGPLTAKAVKRFQKKAGIEQVGVVGPITRSKINSLLVDGAGKSGKVPPGFLIAPGIRKKLGEAPPVPAGQKLPPGIAKKLGVGTTTPPDDDGNGEDPDVMAPVISDVAATSTLATSSMVTWTTDEVADSKVWYSMVTPIDTAATSTMMVSDSALVIAHSLDLSDLTATSTYYYRAGSTDEAGNEATSTEFSFTTLDEEVSE
jgi:hypothetical protein